MDDEAPLSMTAQQKLDAHKRRLEKAFEWRVEQEVSKRFSNQFVEWREKLHERERKATAILNRNTGVMPRATFNKIVNCLHEDTRTHSTKAELDEALGLLLELKSVLVKPEKPLSAIPMPENLEEAKRKATEERKAKRAAKKAAAE